MKPRKACELCGGEAALHCESDSAFLCWACDARVHGANFLVARHPRRVLCLECGAADPDHQAFSGPGSLPVYFLCRSCDDMKHGNDNGGGGSSSDSESSSCCSSSLRSFVSSSCVSSAESGAEGSCMEIGAVITPAPYEVDGPIKGAACSVTSGTGSECWKPGRARRRQRSTRTAPARRQLDARTEGILLSWSRRMGLEDDACALGAASYALRVGTRRMAAVPFRVVVAAAAWFAAKLCCAGAADGVRRSEALLKRLETCSGVPARLIVAAEARLSRAVRRRHVGEGWAECP